MPHTLATSSMFVIIYIYNSLSDYRDKNGDPRTERKDDGKPGINQELQVKLFIFDHFPAIINLAGKTVERRNYKEGDQELESEKWNITENCQCFSHAASSGGGQETL